MSLFKRQLDEYRSLDADFHVNLAAGIDPADLKANPRITLTTSPRGWGQTWTHRQRMIDRKDDYDVFVYQEADILITESVFHRILELTAKVPENWVVRPIRYEEDAAGEVCVLGCWEMGDRVEINGESFVELPPHYPACFVLTRGQLLRVIKKDAFSKTPKNMGYGISETAVLEPLVKGFDRIVTPADISLLVHHVPNKYVNNPRYSKKRADLLKQVNS